MLPKFILMKSIEDSEIFSFDIISLNESSKVISDKKLSEADILKVKEDLDYNIGFKNILEKKLSNKKFVDNAPNQVIENEKKKLDDINSKISSLENKLNSLSN